MSLEFGDLSPFPISPTSMEKSCGFFLSTRFVLKNVLYFCAYPAFCAILFLLKSGCVLLDPCLQEEA